MDDAISMKIRLELPLYFLTHGDSYRSIVDAIKIPVDTMQNIKGHTRNAGNHLYSIGTNLPDLPEGM